LTAADEEVLAQIKLDQIKRDQNIGNNGKN